MVSTPVSAAGSEQCTCFIDWSRIYSLPPNGVALGETVLPVLPNVGISASVVPSSTNTCVLDRTGAGRRWKWLPTPQPRRWRRAGTNKAFPCLRFISPFPAAAAFSPRTPGVSGTRARRKPVRASKAARWATHRAPSCSEPGVPRSSPSCEPGAGRERRGRGNRRDPRKERPGGRRHSGGCPPRGRDLLAPPRGTVPGGSRCSHAVPAVWPRHGGRSRGSPGAPTPCPLPAAGPGAEGSEPGPPAAGQLRGRARGAGFRWR